MNTTTENQITTEQRQEILRQIGYGNVAAICGGRVRPTVAGVSMVCGYGYRVEVTLEANDTYTVRRVYARGDRTWVKGEQAGVYFDEVGEAAYRAGMFRDEWV